MDVQAAAGRCSADNGWIIVAGLTHFNAERAFSFPPGAFTLSHNFFLGLGSAMLIAAYDYWGYYNVCFLGDEVKDPARRSRERCCYPFVSGLSICGDEHQHSGCGAVAGDDTVGPSTGLVRGLNFHATGLGTWAANLVTRDGHVDGVRFRVFADAGIPAFLTLRLWTETTSRHLPECILNTGFHTCRCSRWGASHCCFCLFSWQM